MKFNGGPYKVTKDSDLIASLKLLWGVMSFYFHNRYAVDIIEYAEIVSMLLIIHSLNIIRWLYDNVNQI